MGKKEGERGSERGVEGVEGKDGRGVERGRGYRDGKRRYIKFGGDEACMQTHSRTDKSIWNFPTNPRSVNILTDA